VRPAAAVVLVVAVCLGGCGHAQRTLSSTDRQPCERFAARAGSPDSTAYAGVFAECVHNTLHPERGGG
jgi:hypothetical protein